MLSRLDRGPARRWVVAAGVLILGVSACGGHHHVTRPTTPSSSTTTETTEPPPTTPPVTIPPPPVSPPTTKAPAPTTTTRVIVPTAVAERAALARLVAAYPPRSYAVSAIVSGSGVDLVAVAHDVGQLASVIDVYRFQGAALVPEALGLGAAESLDPVDPGTIQVANITGSGIPDFLVLLVAGDHDNGVLVSGVDGTWHLVGLSDRSGEAASPELVNPRVVGNDVTQSVNDCVPTCFSGSYSVTTYRYDRATGELTPAGPG